MTKKKTKNKKPSKDAEAVQHMIQKTLFPEVYNLWIDDKITLNTAIMLCISAKLDFIVEKLYPPTEEEMDDGEGDNDDLKPEDDSDTETSHE